MWLVKDKDGCGKLFWLHPVFGDNGWEAGFGNTIIKTFLNEYMDRFFPDMKSTDEPILIETPND